MTETKAFVASGTARQPQRFVIAAGEDIDEAMISGEWIATDDPTEVLQ